jgi:hypothetical protein
MLPKLYHRHGFGQFLCDLELETEGVEIGCAFGGFSERILEQWPGMLHLVDPWVQQDSSVYREITNTAAPWEDWLALAKKNTERFGDRAQLHRMFSHEAAPLFPDGSLDFVYIDGNHSFEAVTQDLELWWPKVKAGGLFSGHDYYDTELDGKFCYAKSAVDRWSTIHHKRVHVTGGGCTSWYCFK